MRTTRDCIEINPPQKEIGSVIWLHGLGADGNDFVPIVRELNLPSSLPLRFVFPNAPVRPITINNGYQMRGWFDIYSLDRLDNFDEKGIYESIQNVESLIEHEIQRGIPADKIILAGFSQGGSIALSTGLRYSKSLAGILVLSSYLPAAQKIFSEANAANFTTPIFLAHGTEDNVLPFFLGQHLNDTLHKSNYLVSWHSYVMPHSICQEEIGDIAEWLRNVFSKGAVA